MIFFRVHGLILKVSICISDWTGEGTNGFGVGGGKESAVRMGEEGAGAS